jgi:hypothetical protein
MEYALAAVAARLTPQYRATLPSAYAPQVPHRDTNAILENLRRLCEQADTLQKSAATLSRQLTEQLVTSKAAHPAKPKADPRPERARRKRRSE